MTTIEMSVDRAQKRRLVTAAVRRSLGSAGAMSLALTAASLAGTATAQETRQGAQDEVAEITVTGTRIVRDGYEAPTPLTVMGIEEINAEAPANIADFVNRMPSVAGSTTPQNSQTSISNGSAGINSLNLRGLGNVRTLVLLNGQRTVGARLTGVVDVNTFPQALIERVDVVTGGASSAYGSDAVSGVVNFVLDTDFTGFKSELTGGITGEEDDEQYNISAAFGTPFAGGRGHFLLSGEYSDISGVLANRRDWNREGWKVINNPAYAPGNGQPERLVVSGAVVADATFGGIITGSTTNAGTRSNALRGTAFGPGGAMFQFPYGSLNAAPFTVGAPNFYDFSADHLISLDPEQDRTGAFTRASFELTDNLEVFAQAMYGRHNIYLWAAPQFNIGNITLQADNAFIPESIRQEMQTLGLRSLTVGSFHGDMQPISADNERETVSYVAGLNGTFGDGWGWNLYYQRGETQTLTISPGAYSRSSFTQAIDAVQNANGDIVCRINADANPANDNPACVPWNVLGTGVNSPEAIAWIEGARFGVNGPWRDETFTQDVAALSLQGDVFEGWAGPISLATGAEWRQEEVEGEVDPNSLINNWFVGNYLPTFGKYTVREAFLETVVPLAVDAPFARSLDLNGAVRWTDYSTSGNVTTWKVGATWSPIDDLRFRATRSRDIRAPNLEELFQAGGANTNNVVDPFNNNQTVQYQGLAVGNPNLVPEEADTLGIGVVVQPRFVEGLSFSVDYYNIEIDGAIGSVSPQQIVDQCFTGNQTFCEQIIRGIGPGGANQILQIRNVPFNLVTREASGLDFEASYRLPMPVLGGDLSFRGLMTRYLENFTSNGINVPTDTAGQNTGDGPPDWLTRISAIYNRNNLTVTLTGRGLSSGTYLNSYIECTTGCPTSTADFRTIDNNKIDGAWYLDGSVTYRFEDVSIFSGVETFLTVRNLFDKDPPPIGAGPGGTAFATHSTNPTYYDVLGRMFRAGIRVQL